MGKTSAMFFCFLFIYLIFIYSCVTDRPLLDSVGLVKDSLGKQQKIVLFRRKPTYIFRYFFKANVFDIRGNASIFLTANPSSPLSSALQPTTTTVRTLLEYNLVSKQRLSTSNYFNKTASIVLVCINTLNTASATGKSC